MRATVCRALRKENRNSLKYKQAKADYKREHGWPSSQNPKFELSKRQQRIVLKAIAKAAEEARLKELEQSNKTKKVCSTRKKSSDGK